MKIIKPVIFAVAILLISMGVAALYLKNDHSGRDPSSSESPAPARVAWQRTRTEPVPINVKSAYENYKETLSLNDLVAAFRKNREAACDYLLSGVTGDAR
jgi:hypothetical protein